MGACFFCCILRTLMVQYKRTNIREVGFVAGNKTYIAIDLKSFYASQECIERGLDPLTTNLVVADASRTEKTICLAVTPSLKAYGVSGQARLLKWCRKCRRSMPSAGKWLPAKPSPAPLTMTGN